MSKQDPNRYKDRIEHYLENFLSPKHFHSELLHAIRYSVLNGGKRIRPLLVYITGTTLGATLPQLDAAAAALELMHCYSLIHDDLPAMDNDDLRRGKPTCHKAFSEATAILAGDALQSMAFELLTDSTLNPLSPTQHIQMLKRLAQAVGINGMVGGQYQDILFSTQPPAPTPAQTLAPVLAPTLDTLCRMHQQKTGALIQAAVQMGAIAANCQDHKILQALKHYAENLGLAFQVQDDILDIEGNAATLGKNPGQDAMLNKETFVTLLGLEAAKTYADKLYQQAIAQLETLGNASKLETNQFLILTEILLRREN